MLLASSLATAASSSCRFELSNAGSKELPLLLGVVELPATGFTLLDRGKLTGIVSGLRGGGWSRH